MSTSISTIFDTIQGSVLYPIYYGLLACVFVVALIFLIKDLIAAATAPQGMEQRTHVKQCLVILGICLIMGFAPGLINWFISLSGSGMTGVNA